MNSYILGILWSIGSPIEDVYPYLMLRHRDRYFLDVVHEALDLPGSVFEGESSTGPQYKLKIFNFDINLLAQYGWQPRISAQRSYPSIQEHRDFIRAYFELHSALDKIIFRKRGKERIGTRLRIYGNRYFLDELTKVLNSEIGILPKRVQKATRKSESSGILYYQNRQELDKIFSYLYCQEIANFHRGYYDRYKAMI